MDNFSPLTETQLNEINGGWSLKKALKKAVSGLGKIIKIIIDLPKPPSPGPTNPGPTF
ncbi:bacteriocin [Clostridium cellulovorans]|uniref:Bacteriocin-type signal sequence n=1 Tax=Clostridium cellulovorans (strain ATCC 35296 / DSM 3052 / OCM 3 / 743B) TaxID=573061 RepID=D9SR34_CLOC7|nr:bacteriocin [Clostridium cellulovorans]ADL50322.1 hypothetical protein Clocel_0549 [Clostridium cellulovorans 743B]